MQCDAMLRSGEQIQRQPHEEEDGKQAQNGEISSGGCGIHGEPAWRASDPCA
jgi:hypothetical protein